MTERSGGTLPASPEPALLQGHNLSKRFGATQALSRVGLEVRAGEIRALVGRNGAGKSTLISILTGLTSPDTGAVQFAGQPAPPCEARELWQRKVACVYQHPKTFPNLTCAENLMLGENLSRGRFISWRRMREEARAVFDRWGLEIEVDGLAASLSVGQRQLLEIARALELGTRLLFLDEPTAKLEGREVTRLFDHLRALSARAVGILFISHHLEEIFDLCHTVTVLRDGVKALDGEVASLRREDLIGAMIGGTAPRGAPSTILKETPHQTPADRSGLAVCGLSCKGSFENVSFEVRAGECLGLAGIAGCGKEAIGEALAGFAAWDCGTVRLTGVELPGGSVSRHNRLGVGFVPEDRHAQGLVPGMSVAENAAMAIPDKLGSWGFIRPRSLLGFAHRMIEQLEIKTPSPTQPVSQLSGGNQQRVVFARALARDPKLLVLIHPTAGVDVASKASLFAAITQLAERGAAVLIISDEIEELALCHRVLILRAGRITRELTPPYRSTALIAEMEGVAA